MSVLVIIRMERHLLVRNHWLPDERHCFEILLAGNSPVAVEERNLVAGLAAGLAFAGEAAEQVVGSLAVAVLALGRSLVVERGLVAAAVAVDSLRNLVADLVEPPVFENVGSRFLSDLQLETTNRCP